MKTYVRLYTTHNKAVIAELGEMSPPPFQVGQKIGYNGHAYNIEVVGWYIDNDALTCIVGVDDRSGRKPS